MRNSVQNIKSYVFKPTDELLLDANIWLSVYAPRRPNDWRAAVYSRALSDMLLAQSRIYIDVLIISEFINAYARIEFYIQFPDSSSRPHLSDSGKVQISNPLLELSLPMSDGFYDIATG